MKFTPQQQQAIAARGNVLVSAGAGTGKTRTLVERCLNLLLAETPPVSLDEILLVTFTEAAAAEMRQRIRLRIEAELAHTPDHAHLEKQLALFDTAPIGTLHGFCLKLVRQHFYELSLDPQLAVLPEEEARLLADETLDRIFQTHYAGDDALAAAVQGLVQTQGRGWDKPVRALVFKLHHYTQTLPDPAGWFRGQIEMFESPEPAQWREWFSEALAEWKESSLVFLQPRTAGNELAAKAVALLLGGDASSPKGECRASAARFGDEGVAATLLAGLLAVPATCPYGKKGKLLDPLADFFGEAEFLFSLVNPANDNDPLTDDWNWSRTHMQALLRVAEDFSREFAEAKRELGALDFHDLEQHTLRLLWDSATKQPTATAHAWRKKLRFIFVDEYQDINAAQDKIIEALSRDSKVAAGVPPAVNGGILPPGRALELTATSASSNGDLSALPFPPCETPATTLGNRFLVGDVKQSIYRFRLANPHIFQNYAETWIGDRGLMIPLSENFRSRAGVLDFANSLFTLLMRREAGGLTYDEQAMLRFGAPTERQALGVAAGQPRVELQLRLKGGEPEPEPDAASDLAELEDANQEAQLVALRLRDLKNEGHQVWDEAAKVFREVEWSDMAVLLRSPGPKADIFAKEFSRLGVPLLVARGGFFASLEISDLLSLLRVLDNPLQDLPVLAVLHSPLVGLRVEELSAIRLAAAKVPFWTALLRWHENAKAESGKPKAESDPQVSRVTCHAADTFEKVDVFLRRFRRWRRLVRQVSLSRCLESVLRETHYAEGLLTLPRGEQRRANVQRWLNLAQQFDQFQRQGLFRFLRFVEAQQAAELEPEVAAVTGENAVRLMSIHQSKGLEFPVVVVANLGKNFNVSDLNADILLDENFGLCPRIKPPETDRRYPSLPHWLARRRQKNESLGEELRLLYVAVTRARDTLILTASLTEKKFAEQWQEADGSGPAGLLTARSFADWLGLWFAENCVAESAPDSGAGKQDGAHGVARPTNHAGQTELVRWEIFDSSRLVTAETAPTGDALDATAFATDLDGWQALEQRLSRKYPFAAASEQAAKVSVSTLRREAAELADEEAEAWPKKTFKLQPSKSKAGRNKKSAADIGTAHHKFLQLVALDQPGDAAALEREADRLLRTGALSAEQIQALDFSAVAAFWQSELGRAICARPEDVRRELAFTARFSLAEICSVTGRPAKEGLADEFVVVQGVADLAVIGEKEIWLVDFKTDDVSRDQLAGHLKKYQPQLQLYALALARIHGKPVTQCWLYFLSPQTAVPVRWEGD